MKLTKRLLPVTIGLALGAARLVGQQTNSNAVLNTDIATPSAPASGRTLTYTKNGTACAESPTGAETCTGTTRSIASGTANLGTSAISSGACATVVTVTATGVAATDAIIWNPNASIKAVTGYTPSASGGLTVAAYPASGNVNFDVCNWTSGSITPGAVTLNWLVVR